jgi:thiamine biosynthesis protein ThiC
MKISIDTENDDWLVLKYIRCILDHLLYKKTDEDLTLPTDLKIPMAVLNKIEGNVAKTVPLLDFEDELIKHNFKKSQTAKVIDDLKKHGMIFEVREGFIQRI